MHRLALLSLGLLTACPGTVVGEGTLASDVPGSVPGSPPGSGPGSGPIDPTLGSGEELWTQHCASCHGAFVSGSVLSSGDINGDFRLDVSAALERRGEGLESYIDTAMPLATPEVCAGDCATLTGAYLRSKLQPTTPVNCDGTEVAFGVREFKLLTSQEYENAVEDLLGVGSSLARTVANNDGTWGGFENMRGQTVSDTSLDTYMSNAEQIAAQATAAGRPFACSGDAAACGARFVDEFLYRAFRGPVTEAQRARYLALFSTYEDGLQVALEAVLTAPEFLYRLEAGVDVATARAAGWYTNTAAPSSAVATDGETIAAAQLPRTNQRLDGDLLAFTENGGIDVRFTTAFTEPTTLEVEAHGSNHDNHWPELSVGVNGRRIGVASVDSRELRVYRFEITGETGTPSLRLEFNNDSGVPPYGPGQDANLYIRQVTLRTASSAPPPPAPDPTPSTEAPPLEGAPADAFALSPYELASALSFMLTGSTPDALLLEAARQDQLTTRAQLEAQVLRLIDSPRGREQVKAFVTTWFGLEKVLEAARPDIAEFTPAVKAAMLGEVQEHFAHVFYDEAVPFRELYSADYTFLNRTLAEFYGVNGSFSEAFTQTSVAGRGGPLASGAFMAANAHAERTAPILRAVHARQSALCHYIDPPNAPIAGDDIDDQRAAAQMKVVERETAEGGLSSRDFYFLFTDGIDACAGCHEKIINPMFGMEDFDHVGRLRPSSGAGTVMETIRGVEVPVSLEGTLYGVASTSDPTTLTYAGTKDFSNQIAETEAVQACLIRKSFRFLTGLAFNDRDLDTGKQETLTPEQRNAYGCIASNLATTLRQSGESPKALFVALATENLLRLRR